MKTGPLGLVSDRFEIEEVQLELFHAVDGVDQRQDVLSHVGELQDPVPLVSHDVAGQAALVINDGMPYCLGAGIWYH